MSTQKPSRLEKLRYFRRVADFWLEAAELQARRCQPDRSVTSTEHRLDLNFYVVSITRLQEVAWQLHKRLQVTGMKEAAKGLDDRWPRLRELRNSEEHMKGMPTSEFPSGIWYFAGSAADLRPGGRVEYVIDVESAQHDAKKLHRSIQEGIDRELRTADEELSQDSDYPNESAS